MVNGGYDLCLDFYLAIHLYYLTIFLFLLFYFSHDCSKIYISCLVGLGHLTGFCWIFVWPVFYYIRARLGHQG